MRVGRKSLSQTKAPFRDRVFGSRQNVRGSASSKATAKSIRFGRDLMRTIKNKLVKHNLKHPTKKINLTTAFAVVRRGMGAYSVSHRPFISNNRPNSRVAWGLARLNKFIDKKLGKPVKQSYTQDDDLL